MIARASSAGVPFLSETTSHRNATRRPPPCQAISGTAPASRPPRGHPHPVSFRPCKTNPRHRFATREGTVGVCPVSRPGPSQLPLPRRHRACASTRLPRPPDLGQPAIGCLVWFLAVVASIRVRMLINDLLNALQIPFCHFNKVFGLGSTEHEKGCFVSASGRRIAGTSRYQ